MILVGERGDRDFEVFMGRSLFVFFGEAIVVLGVERGDRCLIFLERRS